MVAAILMREHVGYSVVLNSVPKTTRTLERVAKKFLAADTDGAAVGALVEAGDRFGYANLEAWVTRQQAGFDRIADREVLDLGLLGYEGRGGWFVGRGFAQRPDLSSQPPEFYRAYDASQSGPLLAVLRATSGVDCSVADCCCGSAADKCPEPSDNREVIWCPSTSDGILPAVLSRDQHSDAGYSEGIAQSHGLRFGVRYVGEEAYAGAAFASLSSDWAEVVYSWRPSMLLTRLRAAGKQPVRVVLPSDECGSLGEGGGENAWVCDFPVQALRKLASVEANTDPVARDFLTSFKMPEKAKSGRAVVADSLIGGGIQEMLEVLGARANETRPPTSDEVFEVACEWIRKNDGAGLDWQQWASPRQAPFFADSTHAWYPMPTLLAFLAGALGFMAFIEVPFLWTTLNPLSVKSIRAKNKGVHWRSNLETKGSRSSHLSADEAASESPESPSPTGSVSVATPHLTPNYWKGLADGCMSTERARSFWDQAAKWDEEHSAGAALHEAARQDTLETDGDYVSFVHHTFPCMVETEQARVMLRRSICGVASGTRLEAEVVVEESDGGAKDKTHFTVATLPVIFEPGCDRVVLKIPVVNDTENWGHTKWFRVRLGGAAAFAEPSEAEVLLLSNVVWPANIPQSKRTGWGISLMLYFIKSDRARRGRKWTKTMIAMVWLPVHSVFVSTIVQKLLVDHAVVSIQRSWKSGGSVDAAWFYWECVALVCVHLISLGLNRWADVVQTRNRGRTGGNRQVHRANLLRKFIHLDHAEHWWASDASWLYSAIYDADVITGNAYFMVFVLFQSVGALVLSLSLVVGLFVWSWARRAVEEKASFSGWEVAIYGACVLVIIPLGMMGVWSRREFTWLAVLVRKNRERDWFKSCTWIISNWRQLYGLTLKERVQLEKRVLKQNDSFVPAHWDARDTMNDTGWIATWIQGLAYGFMLLFGVFALVEHQVYGLGFMEVGTFYAFCKIYLDVGKYVGKLSGVFVNMERAIVSLREIAALLNQKDRQSQRWNAHKWVSVCEELERTAERQTAETCNNFGKVCTLSVASHLSRRERQERVYMTFEEGTCFLRPSDSKAGTIFGELRLRRACVVHLGRMTSVFARSERVACTFLGLCAQVLHPTVVAGEAPCVDPERGELALRPPGLVVPYGLRLMMVPTTPAVMGATAPTIIEQLSYTGAPEELCRALVECLGLDPAWHTASLSQGSAQVFSLVKAVLTDPDVLCIFRPLAIVPCDVRSRVARLLRLWQRGGGTPAIAKLLKVPLERRAYRVPTRTLILGNNDQEYLPADVYMDLDELLWKGSEEEEVEEEGPQQPGGGAASSAEETSAAVNAAAAAAAAKKQEAVRSTKVCSI